MPASAFRRCHDVSVFGPESFYDFRLATSGNVNDQIRMSAGQGICIKLAQMSDREDLVRMRVALWPKSSAEEEEQEVVAILERRAVLTMPLVIFVAEAGSGLVGFLEVDLRSHADGCDPARPVAYIEGWYVAEDYRQQGIGKKLFGAAEEWARRQGCAEIASDTWIDNEVSQRAHEALGYEVVDRCVHYRKTL